MQLYAFDENQNPQYALKANKHQNYYCPECSGIVRLRSGMHRRAHFFHLSENKKCFQSGKSMAHLQLQHYLHNLLPQADCFLEHRFPTINRIADLFWKSENIVFEIQCSFITAQEVENRMRDYRSLGIQVIWILHDHYFNKQRLTAAESFLQNSVHYFSNITSEGKGIIYDQLDIIYKGHHRHRLKGRMPVDPRYKKALPVRIETQIPQILQKRVFAWSFYFEGDHIDKCLQDPFLYQETIEMEAAFSVKDPKKKNLVVRIVETVFALYLQIFRLLLEKASR